MVKEIKNILKQFQEEFKVSLEEIQKVYDSRLADEKERRPKISEDERISRAISRTRTSLQKTKRPSQFKFVVLGDSGIVDWLEIRKRTNEFLYRTQKDRALMELKASASGVALDDRKDIFGKPNKYYGNQIDSLPQDVRQTQLERSFLVLEDGSNVNIAKARGTLANTIHMPLYSMIEASAKKATAKDGRDLGYTLSSAQSVGHVNGDTLEGIFKKFTPVKFAKLKENEGKYTWVEGFLVGPPEVGDNSTTLHLSDDEYPDMLPVFVPNVIPIDFGPESKVLTYGRVTIDKSGRARMNAIAAYPWKDWLIAPGVEVKNVDASQITAKEEVKTATSEVPSTESEDKPNAVEDKDSIPDSNEDKMLQWMKEHQ